MRTHPTCDEVAEGKTERKPRTLSPFAAAVREWTQAVELSMRLDAKQLAASKKFEDLAAQAKRAAIAAREARATMDALAGAGGE